MNKSDWGRKEFIWLTVTLLFREGRKGTRGGTMEAGTEAETTEKCCLLACSNLFIDLPQGSTT